MALNEYQRKRHFSRTPEPKGKIAHSSNGRLYLIQKHAARRLHYDFRLELNGVLKSWAVPKGPSLDPADKRLAVRVEDHPVEYGSFEGVIPPHEYGGGTVMLWDSGEWEPVGDPDEGYRHGRLKFRLLGRKLRGGWSLIRMGKGGERENWLLIKEKDEKARSGEQLDILEKQPLSVATGRTMEQIASVSDQIWTSNGEAGAEPERPKKAKSRAPKGGSRKTTGTGQGAGGAPAGLTNARKAPQPAFVEPQLATLVKSVPTGAKWLHELKFDGYRILAIIHGREVRLMTRHEQDWTARFPGVAAVLAGLPLGQAILDGEMVVLRPDGVSDFQLMQNVLKSGSRANLAYYVFDLLCCEGYDLRRSPLLERKELLGRILAGRPADGPVRYSDHIVGKGATVLQHACQFAMEGIICKRLDSPYESGRTASWVKVKCIKRQEFVIGGYTEPGGSRVNFGALLLGYYDDQGRLRFCGKVGTGFNAESIRQVYKLVKAIETNRPPFFDPPRGALARGAHWTRPELVAEIEFSEWTDDGHLRHPSFQGIREDKSPQDVIREEAAPTPRGSPETAATSATRKLPRPGNPARRSKGNHVVSSAQFSVAGVKFTNPDRVLYPEQGLTKRELAEYYEKVADRILPHLAGRPLSLVRCPDGREGQCFYQKHVTQHLPSAIRSIAVREKKVTQNYFAVDDLAGLISLVQIGVLEIHAWGSREEDVEHPDRLVFDLDPGPGVDWTDVVQAARLVREHLSRLKLESFVKTSGGKGLHVVVPITPGPDWDEAKEFTKSIATAIAQRRPDKYTATMTKSKRAGRIFIDYLRNSRGATAVAPYSTRARAGAPISAPLRWDELARLASAAAYTMQNLASKRLGARNKDPWPGFFEIRQTIPRT